MTTPLNKEIGNRVLAHSLFSVGFPLLTVTNTYDEACLQRLGCRSVREAREAGKPGVLKYQFEPTVDLDKAIRAFNATQEDIANGIHRTYQVTVTDADQQPVATGYLPQEDAIRLACVVLKSAPQFREVWKLFNAAGFFESKGGSTKSESMEGGRKVVTVTGPGFVLAGEKVSAEQAKGLGL